MLRGVRKVTNQRSARVAVVVQGGVMIEAGGMSAVAAVIPLRHARRQCAGRDKLEVGQAKTSHEFHPYLLRLVEDELGRRVGSGRAIVGQRVWPGGSVRALPGER